jgi:hypothetical protein
MPVETAPELPSDETERSELKRLVMAAAEKEDAWLRSVNASILSARAMLDGTAVRISPLTVADVQAKTGQLIGTIVSADDLPITTIRSSFVQRYLTTEKTQAIQESCRQLQELVEQVRAWRADVRIVPHGTQTIEGELNALAVGVGVVVAIYNARSQSAQPLCALRERLLRRKGEEADWSAFRPAIECRNNRVQTHKQLKKLLESLPDTEQVIHRRPRGQHLYVHAGDWLRWNAEQETVEAKSLDRAAADVEQAMKDAHEKKILRKSHQK